MLKLGGRTHTDILALPMIKAPALSSRSIRTASFKAVAPTKAYEPHVVGRPADGVQMLS